MLTPLADWVRSKPALRRVARSAVWLIPDRRCTLNVPELGPLTIRMRRHRWYLWEKFLRSETIILGMFARLVRPGDVVYDIGANIGVYTRVLHQWFGASKVVAFEPMTENYELLERNVALGKMQSAAILRQLALSDVAGEEALQVDDMNSGSAVLNSVSGGRPSAGREHFALAPKTERVRVVTLDALLRDGGGLPAWGGLPPPQMMKIDTEGAEVKVLRGARETLLVHRPRLAIALHGEDKAEGTLHLLDEVGYIAYGFVRDPENRLNESRWQRLHPTDAPLLADNNIVASTDEADVRAEIHPRDPGAR